MDDFFGVSVVQMFQRERSNQQQAHKYYKPYGDFSIQTENFYWKNKKIIDQMKFKKFYDFNLKANLE